MPTENLAPQIVDLPPVLSNENGDAYLTKPMVARRLNKCVRTVDYLIANGLPHYKFRRALLLKWSEVEAHLAANYRVTK